jgi:hypothetical protein
MPVSRVLRYVTQFHFGLWLWQLRIVSDSKLLLIIYTGFVWYCMSAYNVLSVCVTYRHKWTLNTSARFWRDMVVLLVYVHVSICKFWKTWKTLFCRPWEKYSCQRNWGIVITHVPACCCWKGIGRDCGEAVCLIFCYLLQYKSLLKWVGVEEVICNSTYLNSKTWRNFITFQENLPTHTHTHTRFTEQSSGEYFLPSPKNSFKEPFKILQYC